MGDRLGILCVVGSSLFNSFFNVYLITYMAMLPTFIFVALYHFILLIYYFYNTFNVAYGDNFLGLVFPLPCFNLTSWPI